MTYRMSELEADNGQLREINGNLALEVFRARADERRKTIGEIAAWFDSGSDETIGVNVADAIRSKFTDK